MTNQGDYDAWTGRDLYDINDVKVGEVRGVYYDDVSHKPEWLAVKTGLFGGRVNFVPIAGATVRRRAAAADDDVDAVDLQVRWDKDLIKEAPTVDDSQDHLSMQDEQTLYRHYGFDWGNRTDDHHGYGPSHAATPRFDRDYETVTTRAQVSVPVEAQVRLRRYQTQGTKTVQVPTSEEHVEVAGVEATPKGARNA